MIKVAALVSGKNTPSSRFRIMQHILRLQAEGVDVRAYIPRIEKGKSVPVPAGTPKLLRKSLAVPWTALKIGTRIPGLFGSWRSQATWLERELLRGFYLLEPLLKSPVILDVDDAIWLSAPFGQFAARRAARRADVVITGNQYLANWFEPYSREIVIIPTAVNTDVYLPRTASEITDGLFRIGWVGTSSNLGYLEKLEDVFQRFFQAHSDALLTVVSDRPPRFSRLNSSQVEFTVWTPDAEIAGFRSLDVGLMPLDDSEWARGKCSFKMLQYMASGVPVVVSPVGMNAEVLQKGEIGFAAARDDEWYDALEFLYTHQDERERLGRNGRRVVEGEFSAPIIARQLAAVFRRFG